MVESSRGRVRWVIELAICVVLVGLLSLNALRRMDYFGANAAQIRMTDESRTAYVAKNIADGNGYSANDLPAALVDFYDHAGKLHDEHWPNADRFPFAAYATAALYTITGSTSWEVGILVYNIVCFVAFLALLYYFGATLFADRYAGVFAVTLALLHPYTFQFLYWKDGDMLLLTTACLALLYRYFRTPPRDLTWKLGLPLGTLLAFLFLSRPNLGAPIIAFFGVTAMLRWWRARREVGGVAALRAMLPREVLVLAIALLWCIPFVVQSMGEWGQPLFSANNLYQLPLGTRFGMGTDTWWKYTEPGHMVTLGRLMHEAPGELISKFTTSWASTLHAFVGSYALELTLMFGWFIWLGRRDDATRAEAKPLRLISWVVVFAVVANLALLPLYGYQYYSYRHYLSFAFPLVWLTGGRALSLLGEWLAPAATRAVEHVRANLARYVLLLVVGLIVWNLASRPPDASKLFGRTANVLAVHWVVVAVIVGAVVLRRFLFRPPWFPRIVAACALLVWLLYSPTTSMKHASYLFSATTDKVWDTLRERKGLVSSFALQGEVAWNTGRKNIPAPEWPMHLYSYHFDHKLDVEDVYIESAAAMVGPGGPFMTAAPGFEGYDRLQQYRTLPGYELAFHEGANRPYAKFNIKPVAKASTVFRLSDQPAIEAMRHSPDRIELGDPKTAIYTPAGWGGYYTIDDKPVVLGTDSLRVRYGVIDDAPYEDADVTFFIDDRHPSAVELDIYAVHATTFDFYWNLDLYEYDLPSDRKAHRVGIVTTTGPGWQHIKLSIPAKLLRHGLNKLGFRAGSVQPIMMCPDKLSDAACLSSYVPRPGPINERVPPVVVHPDRQAQVQQATTTLFAGALTFDY